jgi:hypothetical protein
MFSIGGGRRRRRVLGLLLLMAGLPVFALMRRNAAEMRMLK